MLLLVLANALAARVHVDDLPTDAPPVGLRYDGARDRLVVDGVVVRGSRAAQLEWLRDVFDDHPALRIDERKRALSRRRVAGAAVLGANTAALAVMVAFPPSAVVLIPTLATQAGVNGTAAVVAVRADRALDPDDLDRWLTRAQVASALD